MARPHLFPKALEIRRRQADPEPALEDTLVLVLAGYIVLVLAGPGDGPEYRAAQRHQAVLLVALAHRRLDEAGIGRSLEFVALG